MYKNRMEAEFAIIWQRESDLDGSLWISTYNDDESLNGVITTYRPPKNKMEAEARVELPERKIYEGSSIKDTYVTDYRPTLNYGTSSIMKVGTDQDGYVFRSLVQFGIPEDLQRMRITKAKMVLRADSDSSFEGLEISYPDREWGEYNVVWMGQPSRERKYKVVDLESGIYEYEIDITEAVRDLWNVYPHKNFGLILKPEDESVIQMKNFLTRESTHPPRIVVEYFDEDLFSTTGSVIGGVISVRTEHKSEIDGKLTVFKTSGDSEINGSFIVNREDSTRGEITVSAIGKDLYGTITPHRIYSDIDGKIGANATPRYNLAGYINVMHRKDIGGRLTVRELGVRAIQGKLTSTSKDDIDGIIDIIYKSDVYGEIKVVKKSEIDGSLHVYYNNDIDGAIKVIQKTELKGYINVKYNTGLDGEITVNPLINSDINGSISVSDKNGIDGSIGIIYKKDMNGFIDVHYKKDMSGYLSVRTEGHKDIDGSFDVIYKKDVYGSIKVNPVGFKGIIKVNSLNDLNGLIKVSAKTPDINGVFVTTIKKDLDGYINVRTMDIDDLFGVINTYELPDSDDGEIYAFIM